MVIVGLGFLLGSYWIRQSAANDEQNAVVAFQNGDFEIALPIGQKLIKKNPARAVGFVILGNIALVEGRLEEARRYYSKALQCDEGPAAEKAKAMVGMGRIESESGNIEDAIEYYRQAVNQYPESKSADLAHIVLLIKLGKYDDAIAYINQSGNLSLSDGESKILIAQLNSRLDRDRTKERQQRVDQLINELETQLAKEPEKASPKDPTARPLTMWIKDFDTTGYSLQEGQAQLLLFGIIEELKARSRVRVVERALIEELMEELKLSTSKIADPMTALSLGRIMAARLILASRVVYNGPVTDVTMRLIETETGEVTAVVNQNFKGLVSFKNMANQLSDLLIKEINRGYPLDAKMVEIK
jgi:tetratricopeptide (TPR) repeat protein